MQPGCFCYLANHTPQAMTDGIKSLGLLYNNYLKRFPAPVIIFHEPDLTSMQRQRLSQCIPGGITFQEIEFHTPGHIKDITTQTRVGYLHMCRFFANEIFHHPALADYDYYCRLDTDSFILSPVSVDIFAQAALDNLGYGFINDSIRDQAWCSLGLWRCVERYLAERPNLVTRAKLYSDIQERRLYYTNFELCRVEWFRQEPWRSYFDYIDKDGGIYRERWGDHIIRYIGVRLFMSEKQIQRITSVHYSHQGIGV